MPRSAKGLTGGCVAAGLVLASLIFIASGLFSIIGGFWLSVDRLSVRVDPSNVGLGSWALPVGIALLTLAIVVLRKVRPGPGCVAALLVVFEALAAAAVVLVGLWEGRGGPAWVIVVAERGLWALLEAPALAILYGASAASLVLALASRERRGPTASALGVEGGSRRLLLYVGLLLSVLSALLPHLPAFNPAMGIVSTDTLFNLRLVESFRTEGLTGALREHAGMLRPAYLAFLYVLWRAAPVDPAVLLDVMLPLSGFILLTLATYWSASRLGESPGVAAVFAPLYWAPAFVYGGFQTNLLALPLALASYTLAATGRARLAAAALFLLGIWHPWTLVYYAAAALVYALVSRRDVGLAAVIALASVSSIAALTVYLYWAGSPGAIASLARPAAPKPRGLDGLVFAFYVYVWGTMARPELQLPAAVGALRDSRGRGAFWPLLAPLAASMVMGPVSVYRMALLAPLPLLASLTRRLSWLAVPPALATWLYLIVNSPPPPH